jgi:uncharacterized protein (TIGR02145 family)
LFFVRIEIDLEGGDNFSEVGISQMLSVPFAFHSRTADELAEAITETDPVFTQSEAFAITSAGSGIIITSDERNKLTGIAEGAQVNVQADWSQADSDADDFIKNKPTIPVEADGSETKIESGTNVMVQGSGTATDPYIIGTTASGQGVTGTAVGQILYWNGTAWTLLPPGTEGQVLGVNGSNIPAWQSAGTPSLSPPTVTVLPVTNITSSSATINAVVNPNGFATHVEVILGLVSNDLSFYGDAEANISAGSTDVNVSLDIDDLEPSTTYYYRLETGNAVDEVLSDIHSFTTLPLPTDMDGNSYDEVKIGSQVWMKENLKTTKYSNGDLIGTTTPATLNISTESSPKYQWAYGGDENNVETYGRLYTWYAATDERNICPTGWHVPTDEEWATLETFLGGSAIAGGKLKQGYEGDNPEYYYGPYWYYPNTGANNESGFTGLPAGLRSKYGDFNYLQIYFDVWSATEVDENLAFDRMLMFDSSSTDRCNASKKDGYSVRCIKD